MIRTNKTLIFVTSLLVFSVFTWLSVQENKNRSSLSLQDLSKVPSTNNNQVKPMGAKSHLLDSEPEKENFFRDTKKDRSELLNWLKDKNNLLEERIAKVSEMGQNLEPHRFPLLKLIVSKNPYQELNREPHSHNAYLFRQEAALRVHGMKVLASRLRNADDFRGSFLDIVQNASDETIQAIAQQVLAYNERGRSFFADLPKGLLTLNLPEN